MYRKFASLASPQELGFIFESGACDHRAEIDGRLRAFQTYNDGLVQHSPDWAITKEQASDYLFSIAKVMLTDQELLAGQGYLFDDGPESKDILFASKVFYDEKKMYRYYSVKERKVSSSENKRYDKRWEQIPEWADGKPDAIYRLLINDYSSGLTKLATAVTIHDWVYGEGRELNLYMEDAPKFLTWTKDTDKSRELDAAIRVCRNLHRAHRLRSDAERILNHYTVERLEKAEKAKEVPPQTEAVSGAE